MKLQTEKRTVELEGFDSSPKQFTIKQNARAYEILSSNIYSDKILAVVREYGCNALDAHISVGKRDVPFEVHLPNAFEPWFSIRDFGPGLSDDDAMELYTTYFSSTKNNENDSTGCLGLGSKSAFAYTDQFTITSRFDGVKRVYSAFVGEDGSPSITKIMEEATDEESGLEIYVPVNTNDFSTFAQKAEVVFHRFPVAPVVTGNVIQMSQVAYVLEGSNYKVRKEKDLPYHMRHNNEGCMAVQGSVAYPIDIKSLSEDVSNVVREFIRYVPVDIIFPLGDLNITASRERLNYDKRTQKNIIDTINSILEDIPTHFQDVVSKASTLWEAKVLLNEWEKSGSNSSGNRTLRSLLKDKIQWNGEAIDSKPFEVSLRDNVDMKDPSGQVMMYTDSDGTQKPMTEKVAYGMFHNFNRNFWGATGKNFSPDSSSYISVTAKAGVALVVMDKKPRGISRFIHHNFNMKVESLVAIELYDNARLPEVLELLGNPPYVLSSTLEDPPPLPKVVRQPQIRSLQRIVCAGRFSTATFRDTEVDVVQPHIYAVTYKNAWLSPKEYQKGDGESTDSYGILISIFHELSDAEIIRIRSTELGIPQKNKNWKAVHEILKPQIEEIFSKKNKKKLESLIRFKAMDSKYVSSGGILRNLVILEDRINLKSFKNNSLFAKSLKQTQQDAKNIEDLTNIFWRDPEGIRSKPSTSRQVENLFYLIERAAPFLGTPSLDKALIDPITNKITADNEALEEKYPVLALLINHYHTVGFDKITEYVNLLDKTRK